MGEISFEPSSDKFITLAVIQAVFIVVAAFANLISWIVGRVVMTPNIIFKQFFLGLVLIQLINLIFTETFNLIVLAISDWNLGKNVCTYFINVSLSSAAMSSWLLTFLHLDSYLKLHFTKQYQYWYSKKLTLISSIMWLGLCIIIVPANSIISFGSFHFDNITKTWQCHLPTEISSTTVSFLIDFLLPVVLSIYLFINMKFNVNKNKIINKHLNTVTQQLTNEQELKDSYRPKTPWGDAWRDEIDEKINFGPNNTLPPICSIWPTRQKQQLPSIKLQNEQKNVDRNRMKQYITGRNRKSSFSVADLNSLSDDGLPKLVNRPSLPDIRNTNELPASSPVVAWQNKMQFEKENKENGKDEQIKTDEVHSWHGSSPSGSPSEGKSANTIEKPGGNEQRETISTQKTDKQSNILLTPQNKNTIDLGNENPVSYITIGNSLVSQDTKTDEKQQTVTRLNTKSVCLTDINEVQGNSVRKTSELTRCDTNSIQYSTENNRSNDLNNTHNIDDLHIKNSLKHDENKLMEKRCKSQEIFINHESSDNNNPIKSDLLDLNISISNDTQKLPFTKRIKYAWFKKSFSSEDVKNERPVINSDEENHQLMNLYLLAILFVQITSLPKHCIHFYLTTCTYCHVDFILFYCLNFMNSLARALTPIFIVICHEPFRFIMIFFLSYVKCWGRKAECLS